MIPTITDRFGIPTYVTQFVITIMIFAVIFTIIAVVFRPIRKSV